MTMDHTKLPTVVKEEGEGWLAKRSELEAGAACRRSRPPWRKQHTNVMPQVAAIQTAHAACDEDDNNKMPASSRPATPHAQQGPALRSSLKKCSG